MHSNQSTPYSRSNDSICEFEINLHEWMISKILFGILYTAVFVIAVSGNFLVVYVVVTNKAMQTVTNLFITNLAVSDIVVCLTSLWITPLYIYLSHWVLGATMCHIVPLFQGMSIFISSLTLTAIAVDRYIVIMYPFKKRTSPAVCMTVISFIWILSLMLVAPYAIHMRLKLWEECQMLICREEWELKEIQVVYGIVVLVLQFGLPFMVITVCYVWIWVHLTYRPSTLGPRSDADFRRKRRMLKMLICMVVIFALCWLPPNVVNILKDSGLTGANAFVFYFLMAHVISMSSSMWNPLLYAYLNDNFRREFMAVLPCFGSVNMRISRAFSISRGGTAISSNGTNFKARINNNNLVVKNNEKRRLTVADPDDFTNMALQLRKFETSVYTGGKNSIFINCSNVNNNNGHEIEPLNNNVDDFVRFDETKPHKPRSL